MEAGVLTVLIGGGLLFSFGFLTAVMRRANRDYKATKAALPGLRKGFWVAWWAMIKAGFWIAVALAVVVLVIVAKAKGKA